MFHVPDVRLLTLKVTWMPLVAAEGIAKVAEYLVREAVDVQVPVAAVVRAPKLLAPPPET